MPSLIYTAAGLIRNRFAAQVTTPESLTTVHDNVPNQAIPTSGRWCRLSLRMGLQEQLTVGGPQAGHFRTTGVALAQLFEPFGAGDGTQLELVDAIVDAFRGVTLAGPPPIHFDPPYVSAPPTLDDGLWLLVVTIPFRIEEQV
jgi:hypothetical protein